MNLFELFAKISLDTSSYDTGIANARRSIKGLGNEVSTEIAQIEGSVSGVGRGASSATPLISSYSSALMSLTAATAVVAVLKQVADAMADIAKAGVSRNMQIETYTANLEVLLGSEEKAIKMVDDLKGLDIANIWGLPELLEATQELLAYGIAAEDIEQVMKDLGDISLGNRDKFSRLALAYSQMGAAGKANMQDIRQMINAGFNPLNAIAELTGESMSDLTARVSAGKVAFSEIENAIKYATSAVGTFTQAERDAAAEFAKNQLTITDAVQEQLDAQEAEYETKIELLDKAYKARVKRLTDEEEAIRESNSDKLDELKRAQSAELDAFEDATNAKIALINKQYEENLKLIDEEKYRQLKSIDEQINALKGLTEAEDEAAKAKERAAETARLQRLVDSASSNRFREAAEKQLNEYLEKIRLEDLESERAAKIVELKIQKDAIEEEATAKKNALRDQNKEETNLIRAEAEKQNKILEEQHEDALKNYRRVLADELEALKEKNDIALEEYKKSIDKQKQYITERYELTVADIESTHSALISATESAEGRFYEGISNASDTLAGKVAELETQWMDFLSDAFTPLNNTLKDELLPNASKLIDKLNTNLPEIKGAVEKIAEKANNLVESVKFVLDAAEKWKELKKDLMPWTDDTAEEPQNQSSTPDNGTGIVDRVLEWMGRVLARSGMSGGGAFYDFGNDVKNAQNQWKTWEEYQKEHSYTPSSTTTNNNKTVVLAPIMFEGNSSNFDVLDNLDRISTALNDQLEMYTDLI